MKLRLKVFILVSTVFSLAACSTPGIRPEMKLSDAKLNPETVTEHTLKWLPGPSARIPIAVYGVADQTGSFKPSEGGQTLSRAVTQAPTPILIKALQDAGNRRWFSVIERENLQNILRERQIILDMRQRYLGETELNREALPALKFAGVLIEGAITGYDTNTVTGGAGARYLGIGGTTQYREDAVSVYLRAVSVKTGEVLISISSEQRVASIAASANAFRFVAFQELLEAEAGLTLNQPRHLAVRQAFEKAVYGMIVEGAELGLWQFGDDVAGQAAISHYRSTYARAPKSAHEGVLPDAFYAARQRDIQRMHAAANVQPRQVASARPRQQAARQQINTQQANTRPQARQSQNRQTAQRAQPVRRQTARAQQVQQNAPVQARTVQARLAQVKPAQARPVQATRNVTPQPTRVVKANTKPAERPVTAPAVARTAPQTTAPVERKDVAAPKVVAERSSPQPAPEQAQALPIVKTAIKTVPASEFNQTVLDALDAVENAKVEEGAEQGDRVESRVLTSAALSNLLGRGEGRTSEVRLANAERQTQGNVETGIRRAPPPP